MLRIQVLRRTRRRVLQRTHYLVEQIHYLAMRTGELSTVEIGELLMSQLKGLDKIAYVRFASVYRDFQDVDAFLREVSDLMKQKRGQNE